MCSHTPPRPRRGRGALSNHTGRYERYETEAFDDGWGSADLPAPALRTTVSPDAARTVLTRNTSPDVPFDRSINPYRGCEHGCVYCFARPTHAYLGLSPGLDFESRLFAKPDAARCLRDELAAPSYRCHPIAIGTNTDPYQPIERRLGVTRSVLDVLLETRHPVSIVTKSNLVLRDLDLLGRLAEERLVSVWLSITTLDRELARRLEPRCPTPEKRLMALEALSRRGVPCGVMVAPVIPALTDPELEAILTAARGAGAEVATYVLLRLPREVGALVTEWLEAHAPGTARRVLSILTDMHGGRLYDSRYGARGRGRGPHAELLAWRFATACARLGYRESGPALDTSRFRKPARAARRRSPRPAAGDQLTLFGE